MLKHLENIPVAGVVLLGMAAILGWWTDHAALAAVLPGIADMTFNTALGLILLSIACCLPACLESKGYFTTCGQWLSATTGFIILFASLSLIQDFFGINLGIDNLLFDSHGYGLSSPYPGRMSPMTAMGFLLGSTILIALNRKEQRPQFALTHVLILLLAMLALVEIGMGVLITDVPDAYSHLASISLFTAISFLLMAISFLRIFQQHHNMSAGLLLYSGIQLMYRLKYPQKFTLISIIFIVPLGILMWDELRLHDQQVTQARQKIVAIQHVKETGKLLKAISEHRGMTNAYLSNPNIFSAQLSAKTKQVNRLFAENAAMDHLHAASIDVPNEWPGIMARWHSIESDRLNGQASWQLHTEVIALLAKHLRDVGVKTRLSFDPDSIVNSLFAAQFGVLPDLLELIGELRGQGAGFMAKQNIHPQSQFMLNALSNRILLLLEEFKQLMGMGDFKSNDHALFMSAFKFTLFSKAFISSTQRQMIRNKLFDISAEDYFILGTSTIDQGYALNLASMAHIEQLLQRRINTSLSMQYNIKLMAMATVLILVFLFAAFYRSVMNTIAAMEQVSTKMRRGDMDSLDEIPANDEMGDIVDSFNSITHELMRVNSHMKAVVDYAGEAIITIDGKGMIHSFNPTAEHIFDYRSEEVIGKNITMLMPERFRQRHEAGLHQYYQASESEITGIRKNISVAGLKKDASEFPIELSISAVMLNGQQMFVGLIRDISQRESLEKQLRHAQKMEAVGVMVGGVAHNFNNLLAGIVGKAYLAKRKAKDRPDVLSHLESIESISSQAGDMIKQLLRFAHKDFVHVQRQDTPLDILIREAYKTAKLSIPEDIKLDLRIADGNIIVHCDAGQVQQVLMNMMNNARDAVEDNADKQISIRLDACIPDSGFFHRHQKMASGQYACLSITDNGHGMDADTIVRIFDPFYSTKEVGNGTGLGLSTAFGTIESHHGVIEVDSHPGQGTAFRIYLPMVESAIINTDDAPQQEVVFSRNQETLLLVDDEPLLLHSTKEVLNELGYIVIKATNGAQGLKCFKQHQHNIAAIITDVTMPEMSGVGMFRHIRTINSQIPGIFITGYDQGQIELTADEQANTLILSKPVQIPALSQHIESILKQYSPDYS